MFNPEVTMSDLEAQAPKKREARARWKVLKVGMLVSGVLLAALSLAATIQGKKIIVRQHGVYWARLAIMIVSNALFLSNLNFSRCNAKKMGVGVRCPGPGQWWMLYYKEQPDLLFFGTPMEVVGLAIGLAQSILSIISFVKLQQHDKDPITFSLLPLLYSAMVLAITLFPRLFEPVYKIMLDCGGGHHTFMARAEDGMIRGQCTSCPKRLEATTDAATTENPTIPDMPADETEVKEQSADQGGMIRGQCTSCPKRLEATTDAATTENPTIPDMPADGTEDEEKYADQDADLAGSPDREVE